MTLPPNQRLLWGAIASCECVGAGTIRRFFTHGLSAEAVWKANARTLEETGMKESARQRFLRWRADFDIGHFEAQLAKDEIRIVLRSDEDYPLALNTIYDPPEVLFVRGRLPPPRPSIAVIGTRAPTDYGLHVLERLLGPVFEAGIPIISGLALGIDGLAHTAALAHSVYTCAVLGSGVDATSVYPSRNKTLANNILTQGGGLVSEFPPGWHPRPESFPIRNRIIAGMVQAVVVIEATTDSGTLITARLALEAGREVLAVPGSIWSTKSAGTHQLIRSGARLCAEASDIFEALQLDRVESCAQAQATLPLTPDERTLYEELTSPQGADELSRALLWPIGRVSQALTLLELKQFVVRLPNQEWGRAEALICHTPRSSVH